MSNVSLLIFSNAANGVAGSTAHVYATGTTTPVSTYFDSAGNNAAAQPITCGWLGQLSIFVARGQTVDVVWDNGYLVTLVVPADVAPPATTVTAEKIRAIAAEAAAQAAAVAISEAFTTGLLASANEWTSQQLFDAGVVLSKVALATTATTGFVYVPVCAGAPTGVPVAKTGTVPIVLDTTDLKLYAYLGGAWKSVTLA